MRHYQRAREIVAAAPALNVHVGAFLPARTGERFAGVLHWALLDGPRTIGLVQQHRGVCWAIDSSNRADPRLPRMLSELMERQVRFTESVFGPEHEVEGLARHCGAVGIELAEMRRQQMMVCPRSRPMAPGSSVGGFVLRPAVRRDISWLLEAHAAMCREDLGVDQVARNPQGYARYFDHLVRQRRMVVGELHQAPIFKAEIALESREAWLIEGVYTAPEARGRGCATRAMAWLAEMAVERGRMACLYVHRRNEIAVRVYKRVGFEVISPWATALLVRAGRRPVTFVEF
jgi:predicted GNAT family acetyltransferase